MKFTQEKYNEINIISVDNKKTDFIIDAINLINKIDRTLGEYFKYIDNIFVGEYHQGDAIAASFVDSKSIIITPYDEENIDFIASILVHEITHLYHYHINPKEYSNQEKAEKLAFKNEILFLEKIENFELKKKSEEIRDNLLAFLEENKTTTDVLEEDLKKEDINMSYHQKVINAYFNG